ncbi:hypothetical protein Mgra_00007150, partial [Meloidogyne graminicola]
MNIKFFIIFLIILLITLGNLAIKDNEGKHLKHKTKHPHPHPHTFKPRPSFKPKAFDAECG